MLLRLAIAAFITLVSITALYAWRMESRDLWVDPAKEMKIEDAAAKADFDAAAGLPAADERRLDALERYADSRYRQGYTPEALQLYSQLWTYRDKSSRNEKFPRVSMKLAALRLERQDYDGAIGEYKGTLWYDTNFPGENQNRDLARDLDNLGVAWYFAGLSKVADEDRKTCFKQAYDYFEQSIAKYREALGANSQSEANVLANQYLSARDMGDPRLADDLKSKSRKIMALLKRPDPLP